MQSALQAASPVLLNVLALPPARWHVEQLTVATSPYKTISLPTPPCTTVATPAGEDEKAPHDTGTHLVVTLKTPPASHTCTTLVASVHEEYPTEASPDLVKR